MEFKLPTVERDIAMANLLYAWSVGWDSDPRWQEAAQRLWVEEDPPEEQPKKP